jgi:hypothetical protein
MPAKKITDATAAPIVPKEDTGKVEPTVRVLIPMAEDQASDLKVDQTESVTINGKTTLIRRGEYVDVKVPVFLQLKQRYPNL